MSNKSNMLMVAHKQLLGLMLPSTDKRWAEALKIAESGSLNKAAALVVKIIDSPPPASHIDHAGLHEKESELLEKTESVLNKTISELVIATLSNVASITHSTSSETDEMNARAADMGMHLHAYNAASGLVKRGKTVQQFERAEKYFKQAILESRSNNEKAACLVNYCPIVRDGLITGKPDHDKAIKIYEEAAELGLITGMFNAANVAFWGYRKGQRNHVEKSAYWLNKVIEAVDSGRPRLDMDHPNEVAFAYNNALIQLAEYHIQGELRVSDTEYALKLLKLHDVKSSGDGAVVDWLTDLGLSNRLSMLKKPAINTPGQNWSCVLSALEWETGPISKLPTLPIEIIPLTGLDEPVYFVVVPVLFNPEAQYESYGLIRSELAKAGIKKYFLVSKFGMFKEKNGLVYTPLYYNNDGRSYLTAFAPAVKPAQIMKNIKSKVGFFDKRLGSNTCAISIAVNHLNDGFGCDEGFNFGSRWGGVWDWCVPMPHGEPDLKLMK